MKIQTKEIDKFINNIPEDIKSILIYGVDEGQVKEKVQQVCKSRTVAAIYKYEDVKSSPGMVVDSLTSLSLFGENHEKEKIVIIEFNGASITDPLLSLIKKASFRGKILLVAGELGTDSTLRKNCEANQSSAVIACYADDIVSIMSIINKALLENNITMDNEAKKLFANSVSLGNRNIIHNEIDKLLLYLGKEKKIELRHINQYFNSLGAISFESLCYDLSLLKLDNIEKKIYSLQLDGNNLVTIIRAVNNHFNRLYQVKKILEVNNNLSQAITSLSPPVFFKYVTDFSASINLWGAKQLLRVISLLGELELSVKKNPNDANLIFIHNILVFFGTYKKQNNKK